MWTTDALSTESRLASMLLKFGVLTECAGLRLAWCRLHLQFVLPDCTRDLDDPAAHTELALVFLKERGVSAMLSDCYNQN